MLVDSLALSRFMIPVGVGLSMCGCDGWKIGAGEFECEPGTHKNSTNTACVPDDTDLTGSETDEPESICMDGDIICEDFCKPVCYEKWGSWPDGYAEMHFGSYGCEENLQDLAPFEVWAAGFSGAYMPDEKTKLDGDAVYSLVSEGVENWHYDIDMPWLTFIARSGYGLGLLDDEIQDVIFIDDISKGHMVLAETVCRVKEYTVGDEIGCGHSVCDIIVYAAANDAIEGGTVPLLWVVEREPTDEAGKEINNVGLIIEHEMGHALGIGHSLASEPDSIMHEEDVDAQPFVAPSTVDLQAAEYIYGWSE